MMIKVTERKRRRFDSDLLNEVWSAICRNPRRSLLTAFGVFWGIFMLVVMLSMGEGIKGGMLDQLDSIPQNMTICWPGATTMPYAGFRKGRSWSMKTDDIDELKSKVPEIKAFLPLAWGSMANVSNADKTGSYQIKGVPGNYLDYFPVKIVEGRYIDEMDVVECRKVVVLGQKIVNEIFRGRAPLGQYIKVGGISYQVIGVSVQINNNISFGTREDENVIMPYTLVQRVFNKGRNIDILTLIGEDGIPIENLEKKIGGIMRTRHQIAPQDKGALRFINIDKYLQVYQKLGLGISLLIWLVGIGTLLSGAVGVSNIIMVTIKERTREIGIRRAIGAKPSDIVRQVIGESLILTLLAGIGGLIAGVGLMAILGDDVTLGIGENAMKLKNALLEFETAIKAMAVLVLTGLAAGWLPARRALKIKAIDAIREE